MFNGKEVLYYKKEKEYKFQCYWKKNSAKIVDIFFVNAPNLEEKSANIFKSVSKIPQATLGTSASLHYKADCLNQWAFELKS